MKNGDIIIYKTIEGEVRVGTLLDDSDTIVFGDSLDSLYDKKILKIYDGIEETRAIKNNI